MQKFLIIAKCKVQILPLLITILAFSLLLSLGFWQITRLHEKEIFLNMIKHNLVSPPIDIKMLSDDKIYSKIKVTGHFLSTSNLHLYGRRSMSIEKDGYYLISPFQTSDAKVILVARGWFAGKYKKNIDNLVSSNDSEHEITGIILPSEQPKMFVLSNDIKNNVWFTLDLKQASDILGLRLENFYLMMEGNNDINSNILKNLSMGNLLYIKNDHLEYAITWFALAISLAVIFIIYHLPKKTNDT